MRVAIFTLFLAFAAPAIAFAQSTPTPAPSAPVREALGDAWWTGPMLAPSAGTLPHGHVLVEPYFYDVMQYGSYSRSGAVTSATHSNTFGTLTYVIYGLTDRLSVGVIPTADYTTIAGGPNSNGPGLGDLGLLAQYRISQFQLGRFTPTTSISVQETLPTGRYDNLGSNPNNGFGGGAYSTKISLYMQSFAWFPNGRIVRLRLNLSQTFSGQANITGVSVYGTNAGFHGSAAPGDTSTIDAAGEYSLTRSWVLASDVVYTYSGNTVVNGTGGMTNLGDGHSLAVAPAIEYNWTSNAGILLGIRYYPSGRNTAASLTPAIAINMVR